MDQLDAVRLHSLTELESGVEELRGEFEFGWADTPIGIIAPCLLGAPYDVHTVALDGQSVDILVHFQAGQALDA